MQLNRTFIEPPHFYLFHGRGLISALIRWQTRSPFSHAAIACPGRPRTIIEAWQGSGVRQKTVVDWQNVTAIRIRNLPDEKHEAAWSWAEKKLGKGYDYSSVARFITRRKTTHNDRWFCSELVYMAFAQADMYLLHGIKPSLVSPAMLWLSPYCKPV